jgi:hypothetical protein
MPLKIHIRDNMLRGDTSAQALDCLARCACMFVCMYVYLYRENVVER